MEFSEIIALLLIPLSPLLVLMALACLVPRSWRKALIWVGIVLLGVIGGLLNHSYFYPDQSSELVLVITARIMIWSFSFEVFTVSLHFVMFLSLPGQLWIALTLVLPKPWPNVLTLVGALLVGALAWWLIFSKFYPDWNLMFWALRMSPKFWIAVVLVEGLALAVLVRWFWSRQKPPASTDNGGAHLAAR
jgi:hypothetical protein